MKHANPLNITLIQINALEWFDRINGNSYFSATVSVEVDNNREVKHVLTLPFQYGYGEHYKDVTAAALHEAGYIDLPRHANGSRPALWRFCDENKILLMATKQESCKKRDLDKEAYTLPANEFNTVRTS